MGKIKQNELDCRDTAPLTDIGAAFVLAKHRTVHDTNHANSNLGRPKLS